MAAENEKLLAYIRNEEEKSQHIKSYYQGLWDSCIDWYMNNLVTDLPPGAEWLRGDLIPDAFNFVESALPQWALEIVDRPKHFSVYALDSPSEAYETGIEAWLRKRLGAMDFVSRFPAAMRMAYMLGHIVVKMSWHREIGERQVPVFGPEVRDANGEVIQPGRLQGFNTVRDVLTFNGPWAEFPDLHKCWKSTMRDRQGRPWWWQEALVQNLDWMKHLNRQVEGGQKIYKNLNKLEDTRSVRPGARSSGMNPAFQMGGQGFPADHRSTRERMTGVSEHHALGDSAINTKQWWGYVPPEVKRYSGRTQWRLILRTEAGDANEGALILRDDDGPSYDHRPTYYDAPLLQIADEPYGRTPLHWVGPEIEVRSEFRNVRLAQSYMNLFGIYALDRSANWDKRTMFLAPSAVWEYEDPNGRPANQTLQRVNTPSHSPDAYLEDQLLEQHEKTTFGVTDAMRGEGIGSRATAFEASLVDRKAGGRSALMALLMGHRVEKRVLEESFKLGQVYLDEQELIDLRDRNGAPVSVNARDLETDINVVMEPDKRLDSLEAQNIQNLVATLVNIPGAAVEIDWRKVARMLASRLDLGGETGVLRSEAEANSLRADSLEREFLLALAQQESPLQARTEAPR